MNHWQSIIFFANICNTTLKQNVQKLGNKTRSAGDIEIELGCKRALTGFRFPDRPIKKHYLILESAARVIRPLCPGQGSRSTCADLRKRLH